MAAKNIIERVCTTEPTTEKLQIFELLNKGLKNYKQDVMERKIRAQYMNPVAGTFKVDRPPKPIA